MNSHPATRVPVEELDARGLFTRWGHVFARQYRRPADADRLARMARSIAMAMDLPTRMSDDDMIEHVFDTVRATVARMHTDTPPVTAVTVMRELNRARRDGLLIPHVEAWGTTTPAPMERETPAYRAATA